MARRKKTPRVDRDEHSDIEDRVGEAGAEQSGFGPANADKARVTRRQLAAGLVPGLGHSATRESAPSMSRPGIPAGLGTVRSERLDMQPAGGVAGPGTAFTQRVPANFTAGNVTVQHCDLTTSANHALAEQVSGLSGLARQAPGEGR